MYDVNCYWVWVLNAIYIFYLLSIFAMAIKFNIMNGFLQIEVNSMASNNGHSNVWSDGLTTIVFLLHFHGLV